MAHARTQLRDAIVARLTGLATTAGNVYAARVYPFAGDDLPLLLVTTDAEEITPNATGVLQRSLEVNIRAFAKATANLDDTLDTIAAEVETAMDSGVQLGTGDSQQITLLSLAVEFNGEGDQPHGVMTLTYRVDYFTATGVPGTPL